jgi:drug/metabolite transporter (DMT)-like permease
MKKVRWADLAFFLGFAGVMYAILYGTWNPERREYILTLAAIIIGGLLIVCSFVYLSKNRARGDN